MNPAHIIHECLTDRTWGRGYSSAEIDDASFRVAADTLYAENFGLSILWDQQQDIEAFIERILQHIDGSIYVSPRTGLFTLKLTRDDYDPATLLALNETNVIRLESFERTLPEEFGQSGHALLPRPDDRQERVDFGTGHRRYRALLG